MKTLILSILIFLSVCCEINAEGNLFEKLASGFKLAGKLLGIDHVSEVSRLISKAFSVNKHKKGGVKEINEDDEEQNGKENIFAGFLRIFGFDSKKLAAIGINGIIFMAQLISSSLSNPTPHNDNKNKNPQMDDLKTDEDPISWVLNNYEAKNVLDYSKNTDLSKSLIQYVKERSLDEDTGCIQLLICKLSPFVQKMQNYLKTPQKDFGKSVLYKHLPTIQEIEDNGNICEERHPYCRIIY